MLNLIGEVTAAGLSHPSYLPLQLLNNSLGDSGGLRALFLNGAISSQVPQYKYSTLQALRRFAGTERRLVIVEANRNLGLHLPLDLTDSEVEAIEKFLEKNPLPKLSSPEQTADRQELGRVPLARVLVDLTALLQLGHQLGRNGQSLNKVREQGVTLADYLAEPEAVTKRVIITNILSDLGWPTHQIFSSDFYRTFKVINETGAFKTLPGESIDKKVARISALHPAFAVEVEFENHKLWEAALMRPACQGLSD